MPRELMQRELVIDLPTGEFQVLPIIDPRIIHTRGQISVRLEPIDPDAIWTGHAGRHPRSARAGTGREGGGDGEKVGGWNCRSRRSPKSQRTSIVMQVSVRKISDD